MAFLVKFPEFGEFLKEFRQFYTSRAYNYAGYDNDGLIEPALRDDPAWTPEKIGAAMNLGTEKFVPIKKRLPVLIGYFTAFMDKDGDLNFRKDVYGRDGRLLDMISGSK